MNLLKKMLYMIAAILLSSSAPMYSTIVTGTKFQAKHPSSKNPWTFEIKNKTKEPIYLQLYYQDEDMPLLDADARTVAASHGSKESEHGYFRVAGIDPKKTLELFIWNHDIGITEGHGAAGVKKGLLANYGYVFKKNNHRKAIFVTYERNGSLKAQKGSFGKTQSGLSLTDNVTQNEIIQTIK